MNKHLESGSRTPQPPECLDDDGDDDRLDPVEHPARLRAGAEPDVGPSEAEREEGGRGDEAHPGDDQPGPAGTGPTDVDRHLGGVGAGDEVGRPQEVEELRGREPAPPLDDLPLHHGDVGGRPPERGGTEPQEEPGDLTHRCRRW
jgi:hypothetical protein